VSLGRWLAHWIGSPMLVPERPRVIDGYLARSRLLGFGGSLEPRTVLLARCLSAQLGGCRWCIDRALHDWRTLRLPKHLLQAIQGYSTSDLLTVRERAALAYVEAVASSQSMGEYLECAQRYLSDTDIAELTAIVADHHCLDTTDLEMPTS
jgi:alkylhydroperoxidase family enzyme